MKKVLGIALIIFVVASIATATLALQVFNDGSITVPDLFDGHILWNWDDEDDTLHWNWDDENLEYNLIEEQLTSLPLVDGDTVRVKTSYGRILVQQDSALTDQVNFSLSGRIPASRTWSVTSEKEGSTAYYRLSIPQIQVNKDWDGLSELNLTVTVPEGFVLDLDLETNLGEITAEGHYGDVDIENSLGALRFKGAVDDLNFQLDLGDADIEVYEFDTITGSVNLGSIELIVDDDVEGKHYIAETGLGSVKYHGDFYDTINGENVELRTDLGDIQLWRKDIHE